MGLGLQKVLGAVTIFTKPCYRFTTMAASKIDEIDDHFLRCCLKCQYQLTGGWLHLHLAWLVAWWAHA